MEWIKCSERLPPMNRPVLAWNGKYIEKSFRTESWTPEKWMWTYCDYLELHNVTHWRELPNIPQD